MDYYKGRTFFFYTVKFCVSSAVTMFGHFCTNSVICLVICFKNSFFFYFIATGSLFSSRLIQPLSYYLLFLAHYKHCFYYNCFKEKSRTLLFRLTISWDGFRTNRSHVHDFQKRSSIRSYGALFLVLPVQVIDNLIHVFTLTITNCDSI